MPPITALERHNIVCSSSSSHTWRVGGQPGLRETQVQKTKRGNQSQAVFNGLLLGFMKVIHLGQVVIFKNLSCHQSMCMRVCVGDFVGYGLFPPFYFYMDSEDNYHAWLASTLIPESLIVLGQQLQSPASLQMLKS